jgi:hypothetical protein
VPLILTSLGFSAAWVAAQSSVLSHVAPQHIGKASGTFTMVRQLGGAFGVALAVAVFAGRGSYASAQAFSAGVRSRTGDLRRSRPRRCHRRSARARPPRHQPAGRRGRRHDGHNRLRAIGW